MSTVLHPGKPFKTRLLCARPSEAQSNSANVCHILTNFQRQSCSSRLQAQMEHKLAEEQARRKQEDIDFRNRESAIIAAAEETAAEKLAADAEKEVRDPDRHLTSPESGLSPKMDKVMK
jgi:hypothetical protein